MPMLFTFQSAEGFFIELIVAGVLGHWLCQTTRRMKQLQQRIFQTSAWLGGLTGLFCALGSTASDGAAADFSLVAMAIVGFTSGALAVCGWYLVIAMLVFAWQHVVAVPFRWLARARTARQQRWNQRHSAKLAEQQSLAQREQERLRQSTDSERRDEQKRRDDARFACQMHYDRVSSSIRDQFSPARLQEYFERYLSDTQSAVEVEDRAAKLRDMLDELSGNEPGRSRNGASLAVIRQEYQSRRAEIQAAGFDPETATALLASLAREEERSIREFAQS